MSTKLPKKVIKTVSGCNSNSIFYILEDGTVYSCGLNKYGQLGLNDTTDRSTPTKISLTNVKDIACGNSHTIFLLNDGTVYSCGDNAYGQLGLGLNDKTQRNTPTLISTISNIKDIICGSFHTFFILNDGTVYGCGLNDNGQLGLNNATDRSTPTKISLTNVKDIACGNNHTIFLLNDGTVYSCGYNVYGQLGLNDTTNKYIPTLISLNNVKDIVCGGYHTIFLLNDGTVYSCGYNNYGQLGLNDTTNRSTPTLISLNNVKDIECGYTYTIFLLNDGTVYSCGDNQYGELGLGLNDKTQRNTPTVIPGISGVQDITCGYHHTLFMLNDSSIYGCGENSDGELGLGNTTSPISTITLLIEKSNTPYSKLLSILSNNFTMYEVQGDVGYPCLIYNLDSKTNLYLKLTETKDSNSSNVKVNSATKSYFIDKNV